VFDHFDAIRIINLPRRTDRRREVQSELAKVGLANDPRVQFFAARTFTDAGRFYSVGARECYDSHLEILREVAKTAKAC
jgi:glycosyl transferase family 25